MVLNSDEPRLTLPDIGCLSRKSDVDNYPRIGIFYAWLNIYSCGTRQVFITHDLWVINQESEYFSRLLAWHIHIQQCSAILILNWLPSATLIVIVLLNSWRKRAHFEAVPYQRMGICFASVVLEASFVQKCTRSRPKARFTAWFYLNRASTKFMFANHTILWAQYSQFVSIIKHTFHHATLVVRKKPSTTP